MKRAGFVALIIALVSPVMASNDMAMIVTQNGRPAECLSPIAVNKIDGRMRIVPAMGFSIEPGVHTINGRAALDTTNCRITGRAQKTASAPDLEVNFEAGKTYYIGYDHKSHNSEDWKLVVWKVK